jgi:iduronate 2-sulfatase
VAAETIALLEKNKDRPFFIGAGFYRPHCPFIAPRKYFDLYPIESIRAPAFSPGQVDHVPRWALFTTPPNWDVSEDGRRDIIRAYYASTSFLDANVGRILDALERLQLADNTIVVFASDHGYHLGDRGQWMKQTLFERAVRTPVIIAGPGVTARGQASPRIVEFVDLYPTLADLAGVSPPDGLQGRSLKPLLRNARARWDRPALSQVRRGGTADPFSGYSIRTERWRYTEWDRGTRGAELYDEVDDPDETRNLASDPKHKKTLIRLQRQLRRMIADAKRPRTTSTEP